MNKLCFDDNVDWLAKDDDSADPSYVCRASNSNFCNFIFYTALLTGRHRRLSVSRLWLAVPGPVLP
jgi:hypothetical protein